MISYLLSIFDRFEINCGGGLALLVSYKYGRACASNEEKRGEERPVHEPEGSRMRWPDKIGLATAAESGHRRLGVRIPRYQEEKSDPAGQNSS